MRERELTRPETVIENIKGDVFMLVEWWDSQGVTSDWEFITEETIKDFHICKAKTVGIVLEETDDHIIMALSQAANEQVTGVMVIPQCCIIRKVHLREA